MAAVEVDSGRTARVHLLLEAAWNPTRHCVEITARTSETQADRCAKTMGIVLDGQLVLPGTSIRADEDPEQLRLPGTALREAS